LDRVGWAEDVAAVFAQDGDAVEDFVSHVAGCTEGEGFLDADAALEAESVAVEGFEFCGVHAVGVKLQGLEDVDTHVDEFRHGVHDRTVGMIDDTGAEFVDGLVEADVVRLDVLFPCSQGHEKALLSADVVAGEDEIDSAFRGGEDSAEVFDPEACKLFKDDVYEIGLFDEVDEDLFEAAHVPGAFEDVSVGDHEAVFAAALLPVFVGVGDALRHDGDVENGRRGPGIIEDVLYVRGLRQRIVIDLIVTAGTVAGGRTMDAPDVRALWKLWSDVAGTDTPNIDQRLEIIIHRNVAMLTEISLESFVGRRINRGANHRDGNAVGRLTIKRQEHPFTVRQFGVCGHAAISHVIQESFRNANDQSRNRKIAIRVWQYTIVASIF